MAFAQGVSINKPVPVTVSNFVRAETDYYFGKTVTKDGFWPFTHSANGRDRQTRRRTHESRHAVYVGHLRPQGIAADDYTSRRGKALHVYAGHIGGSLHG